MKTPTIYNADHLRVWLGSCMALAPGATAYVCARPEGWGGFSLHLRLRAAWLVFTGRADALTWGGAQ